MEDFNYIQFMEKYELTSIADEVMIKEELEFLIS